ncbi:type II toxin-antitoxin system RelE/ParE family toxin [Mucilaginibacter myungsuensis]|uniref:Type II toxin-antitoxin system RelE/ParE family toxin n=1 Tax=Mucilaginibacter myungsuensis TaxID=649104 RepID=A0A929L084_9SPHI|nr:type II toxin-antitoxin system RelE/ParE family toxin [Mucilaginibacter myungsuensis]MBE9663835.1 type II toxin-antitoxin system RelE/ParE family toxin [Mucilaginibacter myungsuensis]MDN3598450.1 type II toxin-antitoxin system RelE/ParE family toxin [Mucilaginibacter myungsuensis]
MTNQVFISKAFKREAKRLLKKYITLKISVDQLISELTTDPYKGVPYGAGIYKIRLADASKGKGKSGSFRVLYFQILKTESGTDVLLMYIYDKSERSTVTKADALKKLKSILEEEGF